MIQLLELVPTNDFSYELTCERKGKPEQNKKYRRVKYIFNADSFSVAICTHNIFKWNIIRRTPQRERIVEAWFENFVENEDRRHP